jgi:hypothetical protein
MTVNGEPTDYERLLAMRQASLSHGMRNMLELALRVISEKQAEVEALTGELAGWRGRDLQHCMERDMGQAEGTAPGDLLRTTDTHKTFEWTLTGNEGGSWVLMADAPA